MDVCENQITELIKCVETLRNELSELKNNSVMDKPLYTNQEVMSLLDVTAPKLRQWRYEGLIGYSQLGSKIYFSREDISNFLKSYHNEAYAA